MRNEPSDHQLQGIEWLPFIFVFHFFLKNHVVPRVDCFFIRSPAIDDQMAHYMQTATVVDPGPN